MSKCVVCLRFAPAEARSCRGDKFFTLPTFKQVENLPPQVSQKHAAREFFGIPEVLPGRSCYSGSRLLVSGRPKDALAMLIESGDNSVAVGFAEIVIAGFRPTSCQCIVQVRGL